MKLYKGWRFTDARGFSWDGDCPIWAAQCRTLGCYVETRIMISGRRQPCRYC